MTDPTILSRRALGLNPRVVNFNRITSRPLLPRGLGLVVVHYPGVNVDYAFQDLGKVARSIEAWKPGEYNYLIHPSGLIGELAGEYQAAHCKGYNDRSYGINVLVGVGKNVSDAQVSSFRWLIGALAYTGKINTTPMIVQHGWLAATACPGPVKQRWNEMTVGLRWDGSGAGA